MLVDVAKAECENEGYLAEKINWHNETRRIRDIVPYVANPRQITDKQAKDLKASLAKFGLADPLIINTNNELIGGHQRKKILESLMGVAPDYEIDVRVPDRELSIDEARELNVRLNKNAGQWDFDILANNFELDDLLDWGFDKGELDLDLWADDAPEDVEPQIDKAEELRVKWGVETGQLWQLGEHRLICGDCLDKNVIERVMGGDKADCCVTDPPYGVLGTSTGAKSDTNMIVPFFRELWGAIKSSGAFDVYMCCDWRTYPVIWNAVTYYDILALIVWNKPTGGLGNPYRRKYELMVFARPKTSDTVMFNAGRRGGSKITDVDVWDSARVTEKEHNAQKPVELIERALNNSTVEDDVIFEPFLGSGTTLIACERLGRKCRAVEISPAYVAVAIQRWVDVTGKEPVLLTL